MAVFTAVAGFWSMGLFASIDGYWFTETTKLGHASRMMLGAEARIQGAAFFFLGLAFLSLVQKNALRAGLTTACGMIGAVACLLAPLYIK